MGHQVVIANERGDAVRLCVAAVANRDRLNADARLLRRREQP
jgi:hypothetical protein